MARLISGATLFCTLAIALAAQAPPPQVWTKQLPDLDAVPTVAELGRLRTAIAANEVASRNASPTAAANAADFIGVGRVQLGSLGSGFMVNVLGACAPVPNCGLTLYLAQPDGSYRLLSHFAGWGFALAPSGQAVPLLLLLRGTGVRDGHSAAEISRYRYDGSAFVLDGQEQAIDTGHWVPDPGPNSFPLPPDLGNERIRGTAPRAADLATLLPLVVVSLQPRRLGGVISRADARRRPLMLKRAEKWILARTQRGPGAERGTRPVST